MSLSHLSYKSITHSHAGCYYLHGVRRKLIVEFRATPAKTIIYSTSTAVTMTASRGKKTFAAARNAPEAHALFELSRKRFQNFLADDDREGEP